MSVVKHNSAKTVIVLDFDSTLLCTHAIPEKIEDDILSMKEEDRNRIYSIFLQDTKLDGKPYNLWGVMRKGMDEFIRFCCENFDYVVAWSAGERMYVERLVEILFSRCQSPNLILTRDDLAEDEYGYSKPLEFVRKILGLPSKDKIIIIDDNPIVTRNDKFNCITIPEYKGNTLRELLDIEDDELFKIIEFLKKLLKQNSFASGDHILDLYPERSLARLRNETHNNVITV